MTKLTVAGSRLVLFAAAAAGLLRAAARSGEVDAACLAALRTEGRRAWEQAERFSHRVVVSCRALRTDRYRVDGAWREDVEVTRLRISLNRERNLRLVETHFPDLPWTHRSVVNDAYRFCVSQKPQPRQATAVAEPAPPWQLLSGHEAPAPELWETTVPFEPQHIWFAEASYQVLTVPLAEIVNGPNFHVQLARFETNAAGERQVHLEALYVSAEQQGRRLPGAVFWAKLNPSWLIDEGGLRAPGSGATEYQALRYEKATDGPLFPAQLVYEERNPSSPNGYVLRHEAQYDPPSHAPIDEQEFRLAYYGIPEATLVTLPERRSSRVVLVLGVVALLGVLGGALALWRRRLQGA